ncbi:hypothetical protein OL67_003943 (plasmid) [Phaeobacter piscinae]|nr:hypothetical protein OL67_003943 [Phaeobacter piscinae]
MTQLFKSTLLACSVQLLPLLSPPRKSTEAAWVTPVATQSCKFMMMVVCT